MSKRKYSPLHDKWHPRVEGQIRDAIGAHPEWFHLHSQEVMVNSLAKRIVGEIVADCQLATVSAGVGANTASVEINREWSLDAHEGEGVGLTAPSLPATDEQQITTPLNGGIRQREGAEAPACLCSTSRESLPNNCERGDATDEHMRAEREAFEDVFSHKDLAGFATTIVNLVTGNKTPSWHYHNRTVQALWEGWQAARSQRPDTSAKVDVEWVLQKFIQRADSEYCKGIHMATYDDDTRGWEARAKAGRYGEAEHKAHEKLNKHMGAHYTIYDVVKEVRAALQARQHEGDMLADILAAKEALALCRPEHVTRVILARLAKYEGGVK